MLTLGDGAPRINKSEILSIIIEPDIDEPDGNSWVVVTACKGEIPKLLGEGYLHPPECGCYSDDVYLCAVGWLQEYILQVGTKHLLKNNHDKYNTDLQRLLLRGRMVSKSYTSINGLELDDFFAVESVVERPCIQCHQPMAGKHDPSCIWDDVGESDPYTNANKGTGEGSDECDECDGSGTYYIDGQPEKCICSEPQD